jgi:hypothetical protein
MVIQGQVQDECQARSRSRSQGTITITMPGQYEPTSGMKLGHEGKVIVLVGLGIGIRCQHGSETATNWHEPENDMGIRTTLASDSSQTTNSTR